MIDMNAIYKATVAKRAEAGLILYYQDSEGNPTFKACPNAEHYVGFKNAQEERGRILLTRREYLAARYVQLIGYDPFEDDPSITEDEVEQTIAEYLEIDMAEKAARA